MIVVSQHLGTPRVTTDKLIGLVKLNSGYRQDGGTVSFHGLVANDNLDSSIVMDNLSILQAPPFESDFGLDRSVGVLGKGYLGGALLQKYPLFNDTVQLIIRFH